ncbi:MAG: ABC transporter substrate-binding protein [Candidatus Latescibacter sp.]|nr:ABC transporter substrate-binding protein [Candidatus Latescibacter sp.]
MMDSKFRVWKNLISTLVSVVIACILLSGSGCEKKVSKTHSTSAKLSFAVDVVTMANSPIYIAEAKGFWKDENLNVEIKPFVSGRLALDALVGKSVTAATVVDISTVLAAYQGHNPRIVATFVTSEKHVNMLARRDRGISKPEDLKGKKIAVSPGTSAEFVMNLFLERAGISRSDVSVVALNPPEIAAAISRGDVDAAFAWQPHIYNAQQALGSNYVVVNSEGIYNHPFSVVVMAESIPNYKEDIKKLILGLIQAEKFIKENRSEAIQIVAKRIDVDPKIVEALWDNYVFEVSLDPSLPQSLKREGKWVKKAGVVKEDAKEPDYQALVYRGLLPASK